MKPFPPSPSIAKRARLATPPTPRPATAGTMRSTVLQSLLLCPDGGVETHRHGQGGDRPRPR
jgi:hypothetical protein